MQANIELTMGHRNTGCTLSHEYYPLTQCYTCFVQIPNILLWSLLQLVIKAPSSRLSIICTFASFGESSAMYSWAKAAVAIPEACAHMCLVRTNISAMHSPLEYFFHLLITFNIFQVLNNFYYFNGRAFCPFISTIFLSTKLDCDSSEHFWFWSPNIFKKTQMKFVSGLASISAFQ